MAPSSSFRDPFLPRSSSARRRPARRALEALAAALLAAACSASGSTGNDFGGPSTPGAGGSGGGGGAGGQGSAGAAAGGGAPGGAAGANGSFGAGGGIVVGSDGGQDVLPEGCASVEQMATRVPLTIYITLDRSSSMSGLKWDTARAGIAALMNDPGSAGIGLGLTLFPLPGLAQGDPACDPKNYETPLVDFAPLPGNAALIQPKLDGATPNGFGTPLYPALAGVLARGLTFRHDRPTENFAVLLITDGAPAAPPATCGSTDALDPNSTAALVDKAFQMFGVKTFVVGMPGADASFVNLVAQKGGTGSAILIGNSTDVMANFQAALGKIRGDGLGCTFPLPSQVTGKMYDTGQVNVRYTAGGSGAAQDLTRSAGCADGQSWDYDGAQPPTQITLCPAICSAVKADGAARVDIVLGCPTVLR